MFLQGKFSSCYIPLHFAERPQGIIANVLNCNVVVVSSNSTHAITLIFEQIPFFKVCPTQYPLVMDYLAPLLSKYKSVL